MKKTITNEEIVSVDNYVRDNYEKHMTDKTWIVADGIIDLNSYNEAKTRILWVLKEVHEDPEQPDNSDVDDWDIRKAFNELISEKKGLKGWTRTLTPIIYTTFGILNNMLWDGMDNINEKNFKIVEVIKNIAYINIKKEPGRAVAVVDELNKKYTRDKSTILHQIERFDPDIVIFGGTGNFLKRDLNLENEQELGLADFEEGSSICWIKDNRLYIQAYHPSQKTIKQNKYCDNIINAVRAWEAMNNKSESFHKTIV